MELADKGEAQGGTRVRAKRQEGTMAGIEDKSKTNSKEKEGEGRRKN
jgi:hypothetical protein